MSLTREGAYSNRRWLRNPDVWAPLVLVVSGILFFSDPLFSSKNFYFRDILNFHYPLRRLLIEIYAQWELPLWNPFIYLGQPLLANPNYLAFYPTNLLHAFLPFNFAFKLHFILHPLLGGLGLYFLQKRLGIHALAALGGSVIYQFSGTVLSFLNLYNIVPAVALMPWAAWAFLGALRGNWWRRSLLFGVILALQIVASEPLTSQCTLFMIGGLALFHVLGSEDRFKSGRETLRTVFVAGTFGLALAAVQLIPTIELIPRSTRGSGYDFDSVTEWSMHPADLVNIIVPDLFGNPYTLARATHWGESFHAGREPYLVSFYLGAGAMILLVVSFLSERKKLQRILIALTLLAVALALGRFNPLYEWIYDFFPVVRLGRHPSKYFLLGTLSLALMSSLGLEVILKAGGIMRRKIILSAVVGLVLTGAFFCAWAYCQTHPREVEGWLRAQVAPALESTKDFSALRAQLAASLRSSCVFLLISSLLVLVSPFWRRPVLLCSLFILILGADLGSLNLRLTPLISDADVDSVPELITYLQQKRSDDLYRIVPASLLKPMPDIRLQTPNTSVAWLTLFFRRIGLPMYGIINGIQYSLERSVDHLNTRDSDELWNACVLLPEEFKLTLLEKLNSPMLLILGEMRDPRLRLLASFDTRSDVKLNVYWLENSLPRAYFASGVEIAASHKNALERLVRPDFSFGNTVILEDSRVAKDRVGETGAGVARVVAYRNNRVICEVEAKTPGYLVLLDSYFPGWQAYVDGNEVNILRANYAFRAVEVRAGKHKVEFLYRPRIFYAGLSITCLALILGVIAAIRPPRRFL